MYDNTFDRNRRKNRFKTVSFPMNLPGNSGQMTGAENIERQLLEGYVAPLFCLTSTWKSQN